MSDNTTPSLPPGATGGKVVPLVAAPASASASASFKSPDQESRNGGTRTPRDWEDLLQERIGIMEESGILSSRAFALALADTRNNYGPRPVGEV